MLAQLPSFTASLDLSPSFTDGPNNASSSSQTQRVSTHPQPSLELTFIYGQARKLIMYRKGTEIEVFLPTLRRLFSLPNTGAIKLIDTVKFAEITSWESFKEERPIQITLEQPCVLPLPQPSQSEIQNVHHQNSFRRIEYRDLLNKKFIDKTLVDEINLWAKAHKFKMRASEGIKDLKNEFKRTLICSEPGCPYKLFFKSLKPTEDFQIYEKLTDKYVFHSKYFLF